MLNCISTSSILLVFFERRIYIVGVTYNVKNVDINIPPNIVEPTAKRLPSPAPGPMFPINRGTIAIIVESEVIIIARNLLLDASTAAVSMFFPALLSWLAQSTFNIYFLLFIKFIITRAICENIFMLELKSKIKIIPPNTLKGTVNIITTG